MPTTIDFTNEASVLAGVSRWPEVFREEFIFALELAGDLIVGAAIQGAPVDDGTLTATMHRTDATPTQQGWQVGIGDAVPYGEVIEMGRKPGGRMPPADALLPWVWSHAHYFPDIKTEKDAKGLAFVIARSIGKRGFSSAPDGKGKGWGMYQKAVDATSAQVDDIFAQARKRIDRRCTALAGGS